MLQRKSLSFQQAALSFRLYSSLFDKSTLSVTSSSQKKKLISAHLRGPNRSKRNAKVKHEISIPLEILKSCEAQKEKSHEARFIHHDTPEKMSAVPLASIECVKRNSARSMLKFLKSSRKKSTFAKEVYEALSASSFSGSSEDSTKSQLNNDHYSYIDNAIDSSNASVYIISQWLDVKKAYPSSYIILFQVGDFYELYGEDAEKASRLLDLALTKKRYSYLIKILPGSLSEGGLSFTGFPVKSVEFYMERFLKAKYSIVICDQVSPFKGNSTGEKIQRKVTRVITPGTITEENLLEKGLNNYILSISLGPHSNSSTITNTADKALLSWSTFYIGLAWMDLSTGYYVMTQCPISDFEKYLSTVNPKEVLIDTFHPIYEIKMKSMLNTYQNPILVTPQSSSKFEASIAEQKLQALFEKHPESMNVKDKVKAFSPLELQASGALLEYIFDTQLDKKPLIEFPAHFNELKHMNIDTQAFKALEILNHFGSGEYKGSLIEAIDATITASGARLFVQRLRRFIDITYALSDLETPLLDMNEIHHRLDFIELFTEHSHFLNEILSLLKQFPDLERSIQRLSLNRPMYGPRDMATVKRAIFTSHQIKHSIERCLVVLSKEKKSDLGICWKPEYIELLKKQLERFEDFAWLANMIDNVLVDPAPTRVTEGGLIRENYDIKSYGDQLAGFRSFLGEAQQTIFNLQKKYKLMTKKDSLKIVSGRFFGLLVAVHIKEGEIEHPDFKFDSMTQSIYRYQTAELNEMRIKYAEAEMDKNQLELEIYEGLREKVVYHATKLRELSKVIAEFDVASGSAKIALSRKYTRPMIRENFDFKVIGGRHPVIEEVHSQIGRQFVKNDCLLSPQTRLSLITGPNMGGKSTFLRQNALIAIMAQAGCFVPADSAIIGMVDAVFTRIGAGDDITKDKSTFMTEMTETAKILKSATKRSLIIMDEVGRGTSTSEGFSLAWAISHYLYHHNQSRTLFATHYHELGSLIKTLPKTSAYMTTTITEKDGTILFLHKLVKGIAARSFGIHIAELAGIPQETLVMAKEKYQKLLICRQSSLPAIEEGIRAHDEQTLDDSNIPTHSDDRILPLPPPNIIEKEEYVNAQTFLRLEEIRKRFQIMNLEEISGRQALNILYDLREICNP